MWRVTSAYSNLPMEARRHLNTGPDAYPEPLRAPARPFRREALRLDRLPNKPLTSKLSLIDPGVLVISA